MVIVKLQGGLGNQLFQYAAGKALAERRRCPLLLDDSFLQANDRSTATFTARKPALDIFGFERTYASPDILNRVRRPGRFGLVRRLLAPNTIWAYTEQGSGFDPAFRTLTSNIWLDGYWQSERYFADIETTIRRDLNFTTIPDHPLLERIRTGISVAVHVRRGDYISSQVVSEKHGHCPLSYYLDGMTLIRKRWPDAEFYIFSDDPAWAEANLAGPGVTLVQAIPGDERPDRTDLFLMSQCKHQIIANSTFSWWGAWLNPDLEKIVIAPQNWYRTPPTGFDLDDLLPATWLRR